MKKSLIILSIVLGLAAISFSCKKTDCHCTATKNGQTLDSYTYKDLERSECESKVDEASQRMMEKYGSSAVVGVTFECSHL